MDITDAAMVEKVFEEVKPTLVYHCAAYTAVDAAEDEGKELDFAINVTGTENVAKASEKHGATLVYISTDYVFDGKKPVGQEWEVDDKPDPQTEYGRTKRMGEELVEKHVSNFYIIRTAWVFGNYEAGTIVSRFCQKSNGFCRCFLHGCDSLGKIELLNKPFRKAIPCIFTITQIKQLYH